MIQIKRFGVVDKLQSSKQGSSRVSRFLARLEDSDDDDDVQTNTAEQPNVTNKPTQSISTAVDESYALEPPKKKQKLSNTTSAPTASLAVKSPVDAEPSQPSAAPTTEAVRSAAVVAGDEDPWNLDEIFSNRAEFEAQLEAKSRSKANAKARAKAKKSLWARENEQDTHKIYQLTDFPKPLLPSLLRSQDGAFDAFDADDADPTHLQRTGPTWMKSTKSVAISNLDSSESLPQISSHFRFDARLLAVLAKEGYSEYFPTQLKVIPSIMSGFKLKRDIAVCAPTGSGKTLAYALPMCQILSQTRCWSCMSRVSDICHVSSVFGVASNLNNFEMSGMNGMNGIKRGKLLRALIVAPSRDLATQIFVLMQKLGASVGLTCALSAGQRSLREEQQRLFMASRGDGEVLDMVDILVCTPGRLVDHLDHTRGFGLQNLEFLVLDEADRLSNENTFQDWLYRIHLILDSRDAGIHVQNGKKWNVELWDGYDAMLVRSRGYVEGRQRNLMKILISATLTHDPRIISSLHLHLPLYLNAATLKKYLIPSNLEQYKIVLLMNRNKIDKLLYFLALMQVLVERKESAIVFCNKVETTHKLRRLVEIVFGNQHNEQQMQKNDNINAKNGMNGNATFAALVHEFSRNIPNRQRGQVLRRFRAKQFQFLTCSDAMSRGLDVPHLDCVINYQTPSEMKTYVHRIGRTARALHKGKCFTFVEAEEEIKFDIMLESAENGIAKHYYVEDHLIAEHTKHASEYLKRLNQVEAEEENGTIDVMQSCVNDTSEKNEKSDKMENELIMTDDSVFMSDKLFDAENV